MTKPGLTVDISRLCRPRWVTPDSEVMSHPRLWTTKLDYSRGLSTLNKSFWPLNRKKPLMKLLHCPRWAVGLKIQEFVSFVFSLLSFMGNNIINHWGKLFLIQNIVHSTLTCVKRIFNLIFEQMTDDFAWAISHQNMIPNSANVKPTYGDQLTVPDDTQLYS